MARLPVVGGDRDNWGTVLNDYLSVEHNPDGTLKLRGDGTLTASEITGAATLTNGVLTPAQIPGSVVRKTEVPWDVNALDHGAVGDGVANDTAAIQAAWDAASALGTPERPAVLVIPPGTYLTDVIIPKSNVDCWGYGVTIKKRSDSSSSQTNNTLWRMLEVLNGSTYYGTYQNISMRGLKFSGNGKSAGNTPDFKGSMLRFLYVENLLLEDIEITDYCATSWALNLGGSGVLRRIRIRGGEDIYEDGIHIMFGDWTIADGYDVEAGDDAISLGCEPGDPYVAADPQPLTVRIGKGRAVSAKVAGLKIYQRANATADMLISDVQVDGLDAWGKSAPAIWFNDERGSAAGSSLIKRCKIRGRVRTGNSPTTASSAFSGLARMVHATNADDIEIDVTGEFLQDTSAASGWRVAEFIDCQAPDVNIRITSVPKSGGVNFTRSTRAKLRGKMVATSDTNAPLVTITDSEVEIIQAELLSQKSGNSIVSVATGSATSSLKALGGRWSHASGATAGLIFQTATAADTAFVSMRDVDLRSAYLDTGSTPPRPLGSNFSSIAVYDIQNCPGLLTRLRGNANISAGNSSVQISTSSTNTQHIDLISARQIEFVGYTTDPGSGSRHWFDNQGPNGFRWNLLPAPAGTVSGYYIIDVGRKPAN